MLKLAVRHGTRLIVWCTLAAVLLVGAVVLGLRYGVMPRVEDWREEIAAAVSREAGAKISIGGIRAVWHGLRPEFELLGVRVLGPKGETALELVRVEATLSWRSLLAGGVRLSSLDIYQPTLEVRRESDGRILVAGIPLRATEEGGGVADWMLQQREIVIHDAVVAWEDRLKGLPPIALEDLTVRLSNRGKAHRFGLAATLPSELGGRAILRGELAGARASELADWRGRLYAELPYADAAAWRRYLPVPEQILAGRGALRAWLDVHGPRVESVVADVKLARVSARWNETLPPIDLDALAGRFHYRAGASGFELASQRLSLSTRDRVAIAPMDFRFVFTPGEGARPTTGELTANRVELGAVASLLRHLPAAAAIRETVAGLAPSGLVQGLELAWTGEPGALARYRIRGRVEGGSVLPFAGWPGANGVTGEVEGNEQEGRLTVASQAASLTFPGLFGEPLHFQTLAGRARWKRSASGTEIAVEGLDFANADLAGNARLTWRSAGDGPGVLDLQGKLSRVVAASAWRYVPLLVGADAREWLAQSIRAGQVGTASVLVKGDLREFPFTGEKHGIFRVEAALQRGVLRYAEGWPAIEGIDATLLFSGPRMEITARQANMYTARLSGVQAVIADLGLREPTLKVRGGAAGPVADKLRFLADSPLAEHLGAFIRGARATGAGRLDLKLEIPLAHSRDTQVAGRYQFDGASLEWPGGLPPFTGITGALSFTEHEVSAQQIKGQAVGGPLALRVRSSSGAVTVEADGTATVDAVKAAAGVQGLAEVSGASRWHGTLTLRDGVSEGRLESPLSGVASSLPEPLAKAESEERPLALTWRAARGEREVLRATLGEGIAAAFDRPANGKAWNRGLVSFGRPAALPGEDGLWLTGDLTGIDLDRWRARLADGASAVLPLAGVDVRFGALTLADRRFTDVRVSARRSGADWAGTVDSPAASGELHWFAAGEGRIEARLARLHIPEERSAAGPAAAAEPASESHYPALAVTAEDLRVKGRRFGRLELKAERAGPDWRINRLALAEGDARLSAQGLWRRAGGSRSTLKLELVAPDAGLLLASLGFPGTVRRGEAKLAGELAWPGAPFEMQPGRLSGELKLEAKSGQFLKAEPGPGRLLGLMSLQSLPRRVSFDFRDLFSDGFAFDSLGGTLKIRDGVLSTSDFALDGPSAKVRMAGDVNLASETQDLKVTVTPSLSEGLSLGAGFLGGPVVGISALLVQKVLGNPLEKGFAAAYGVTGTWDNPTVTRLSALPAAPAATPKP